MLLNFVLCFCLQRLKNPLSAFRFDYLYPSLFIFATNESPRLLHNMVTLLTSAVYNTDVNSEHLLILCFRSIVCDVTSVLLDLGSLSLPFTSNQGC